MTTARSLRKPARVRATAAGWMWLAVWAIAVPGHWVSAQPSAAHWLHAGVMPPGAIGGQRLLRGGPLSCYIQPVELTVPEGAAVSVVTGGGFAEPHSPSQLVGMRLAMVYRLRVTGIPNFEETEVYPTVELIDRLYPPAGKVLQFPVPVELTKEDLQLAAQGSFVTRVIYVEDPAQALPIEQKDGVNWFEAQQGEDPLVTADTLGRPIAILRIGARRPPEMSPDGVFSYGCPPIELYDNLPQTYVE